MDNLSLTVVLGSGAPTAQEQVYRKRLLQPLLYFPGKLVESVEHLAALPEVRKALGMGVNLGISSLFRKKRMYGHGVQEWGSSISIYSLWRIGTSSVVFNLVDSPAIEERQGQMELLIQCTDQFCQEGGLWATSCAILCHHRD